MQRPRRKPWPLEAAGGPGGRGWPHGASDAALPASQLRGAPGRRPAPAQPRHPASTSGRAAGLVVGERVPQKDEDQDEAGGSQRGAGDVEEPGRLGIFHRPGQVVEQLLVPDLRPRRGVSCGADAGPPGGRREPPRPAPRPPTARPGNASAGRVGGARGNAGVRCLAGRFPASLKALEVKRAAGCAAGTRERLSTRRRVRRLGVRREHVRLGSGSRGLASREGPGASQQSRGVQSWPRGQSHVPRGRPAAHACPRLWVPPSLNEPGVPDHGRCAGPGAGRPPGRREGVPR